MAARRPLVLLLVLVALAGVVAWQHGAWAKRPAAVKPAASPSIPAPRFEAPWATEQEFLVDSITREVGALAVLAGAGSSTAGAIAKPTRFQEHLFSPAAYVPAARQALAGARGSGPAGNDDAEDARLVTALVDLRTPVLLRENAAVARQIAARPLAAAPYERAALLLGAFALRDAAGDSTDVRPALCRATAHLAVASALREGAPPGLAGRLAEVLVTTLVGRQRDALAQLDTPGFAGVAVLKPWSRALRLRNTGDWRIARDAKGLSLLERFEEFRALVRGQGDATALVWLDRGRLEPIVDWALIALNSPGVTVEAANRFCDAAPMLQLAEAAEARSALRGGVGDEGAFVEALNDRPGSGRTSRERAPGPLAWEIWADRTQRHLVFELLRGAWYWGGILGRPGEARAYAERARERFGRLSMYAIVLRGHAHEAAEYRAAMAAVRELALRSPERLTCGHWELFLQKEQFAPVPGDLPDVTSWFHPALPPGTVLDLGSRLELLPELQRPASDALQKLRDLAPYNVDLALFAAAQLPPVQRTVGDQARVFGPLAEFNVRVMGKLADAAWYDPVAFRERQGALCEVVPERCFLLGYRLAELGFADEAAAAYQKGFDGANDRVMAANRSRWLVDYYLGHGQPGRAAAVAERAADAGSAGGLLVMATMQEKTGHLAEAEEFYRRVLDRYREADDLVGFYYRQARGAGKAAYEPKLRDALALALPSGLEPLDRAALAAPPSDGVVVRKENDNTKRCGIRWGDVIVGLDGHRVRDRRAYEVVNSLSLSPRLRLVVWHGGRYHDVTVDLWDRSFRVDLEDMAARK